MLRAESAQREEDSPAILAPGCLTDSWSSAALARAHSRLLGHFTDDRLKLEQLHLRLRQFFSARSLLSTASAADALPAPNPQFRIL